MRWNHSSHRNLDCVRSCIACSNNVCHSLFRMGGAMAHVTSARLPPLPTSTSSPSLLMSLHTLVLFLRTCSTNGFVLSIACIGLSFVCIVVQLTGYGLFVFCRSFVGPCPCRGRFVPSRSLALLLQLVPRSLVRSFVPFAWRYCKGKRVQATANSARKGMAGRAAGESGRAAGRAAAQAHPQFKRRQGNARPREGATSDLPSTGQEAEATYTYTHIQCHTHTCKRPSTISVHTIHFTHIHCFNLLLYRFFFRLSRRIGSLVALKFRFFPLSLDGHLLLSTNPFHLAVQHKPIDLLVRYRFITQ